METRAHYVLVGTFTIVVGAAALLFALWMSRATLDADYRHYDIVFTEAVSGLSVGSPVLYSGIRVGEVERLTLDPDDPRQVWARVRIVSTAPVKTDTTARLALLNITGSSSIALGQGLPSSPLLAADNGVPVIQAEPSSMAMLRAGSEDLMLSVTTLLDRANALLSTDNARRVTRVLENLEAFTVAMNDQQGTLREGLESLATAGAELTRLLSGLDEQLSTHSGPFLETVNSTMVNLESFSERLDTLLDENSAAMGNGMQSLSELAPAMQELRGILNTLSEISRRLEDDPAAFLLGTDNIRDFEP